MRPNNFYIALIFALVFFSCSGPKNIIKLQPENEGAKWLYGQNFVSDSLFGVIYEVSFDRYNDNKYWFDFKIINRSNMTFLVDPVDFKCQAYDAEMSAITIERQNAYDPEKEIIELEKDLARNKKRQKASLGLSIMAAGIDVAAGIVTDNDDGHHPHFRTHIFEGVMMDNANTRFEEVSINDLLQDWKNSTIRKTNLDTHYSMHGKVFFPAHPEASYFKIFIPVDDQYIQFDFSQHVYPLK